MFGNIIDSTVNLPVSTFIPDTTSPSLIQYDLNLSSEIMSLTFSESVALFVNPTSLIIQRNATLQSPHDFELTTVHNLQRSVDGTQLSFQLDTADLNTIKKDPTFAVSRQLPS